MRDIQTNHSADYSFPHRTKGVTVLRSWCTHILAYSPWSLSSLLFILRPVHTVPTDSKKSLHRVLSDQSVTFVSIGWLSVGCVWKWRTSIWWLSVSDGAVGIENCTCSKNKGVGCHLFNHALRCLNMKHNYSAGNRSSYSLHKKDRDLWITIAPSIVYHLFLPSLWSPP